MQSTAVSTADHLANLPDDRRPDMEAVLKVVRSALRPGSERDFRARWNTGRRTLDMGTSCLRYRKATDLDLALVAEAIGKLHTEEFIALYERSRSR